MPTHDQRERRTAPRRPRRPRALLRALVDEPAGRSWIAPPLEQPGHLWQDWVGAAVPSHVRRPTLRPSQARRAELTSPAVPSSSSSPALPAPKLRSPLALAIPSLRPQLARTRRLLPPPVTWRRAERRRDHPGHRLAVPAVRSLSLPLACECVSFELTPFHPLAGKRAASSTSRFGSSGGTTSAGPTRRRTRAASASSAPSRSSRAARPLSLARASTRSRCVHFPSSPS